MFLFALKWSFDVYIHIKKLLNVCYGHEFFYFMDFAKKRTEHKYQTICWYSVTKTFRQYIVYMWFSLSLTPRIVFFIYIQKHFFSSISKKKLSALMPLQKCLTLLLAVALVLVLIIIIIYMHTCVRLSVQKKNIFAIEL